MPAVQPYVDIDVLLRCGSFDLFQGSGIISQRKFQLQRTHLEGYGVVGGIAETQKLSDLVCKGSWELLVSALCC